MPSQDSTRDIVLRMEGKLDSLCGMVKAHETDLNGNGKPGLKSDVRTLADKVTAIEVTHGEQRDFSGKIRLMVIGQVLTVVGLAVALIFGLR